MASDPLTDIVRSLDLTGAVFLEADFTEPWAIVAQVTEEDCRPYMPMPRQVIAYHVMTAGEAIVLVDGHECCRARAGDVVFLPSNTQCVMASAVGVPPVLADDLLLPAGEDGLVRIRFGGGGRPARMLCGFIASNAGPNPLLDILPETLVIGIPDVATFRWIEASIAMAARELIGGRLAAGSIMGRLVELLLVEALRLHLENADRSRGWLAGMADPRVARALAAIHGDLAAPAAVTTLADAAGMSRSAFVARFTEILGIGPRQYVIDQRIAAARLLLRETGLGLAEIGARVGYDAPEAFSRAFKRETGRSPTDWRKMADS